MKLKVCFSKYRWPFIGLIWILAIVLGYIGSAKYFAITGQTRSVWDTLYTTLQLFVLESGEISAQVGWQLQVARFLAPFMTIYTILQVGAIIFREQIELLRMHFLKDHIVICGLGRKGYLLAKAFRRRGERVVVIERDTGNDFIVQCRQNNIMVLTGNATDLALLRQAKVNQSRNVICVCGDDGTNAQIAAIIHGLIRQRKGKTLSCLVHIFHLELYNLLREREISMGELDAFRLEFFNVFESGSRVLLQDTFSFNTVNSVSGDNPHIVVVGVGHLGESLVLNLARTWWEKRTGSANRPRITLVDDQAKMKKELLTLRYPQLEEACEIVPEQIDIKDPDFERARFLFNNEGSLDVTEVYICLDDDSNALKAALTLLKKLRSSEIPIVVRTSNESGLTALLRKSNLEQGGYSNIQPFGLLDRTCTPELISSCTYEVLARAVHQQYVDNESEKGLTPETNPSMVPWENLPETLRESNVNQVEHIRVKLEAIGCDIAVTNEWEVAPFRFSPDEIELMAQMEHERFIAERLRQGFRYAPLKDFVKKSPSLIPWQKLSDSEKDKDRNSIRHLPEILAKARFQIYRFRQKRKKG
jgi:voltage-gated potassium channel Kch